MNEKTIIFKNPILEVKRINEKSIYGSGYKTYEIIFLNEKTKINCNKIFISEIIDKRLKAYDLIPEQSAIITKEKVNFYNGKIIGGIIEDSIEIVYGLCKNGLRGFDCSVFFLPTKEKILELTEVDLYEIEKITNSEIQFKSRNYISVGK